MNRKEFLKSIGASATLAITVSCLGGCSSGIGNSFQSDPTVDPTTGALLTIDLTAASSKSIKNNGGYLIRNNIIVAKDMSGNYVAATVVCSHQQRKQIIFRNSEFYCTAHGARYNLAGKGLNNNGGRGLTIYKTYLKNNILSITA